MGKKLMGLAALGMLVLVLASVASATAASNTVPKTSAGQKQQPTTANDLKPPECASLNLTATLPGSGTVSGTAASELIFGSSGADTVDGKGAAIAS